MTTRNVFVALALFAWVGWLAGAFQVAPPPTAPYAANATAGRFAVQDSGKTVLDRSNGLRWQQGFSAKTMNWADAKTWCAANTPALPGSGWRLPTIGELVTLVDVKNNSPAIDSMFAGTPNELFRASTPSASGGSAWLVFFYNGYALHYDNDIASTYRVRCVR